MSLENAIDLFMKKSDLQMHTRQIVFCFGMSKMTVTNENDAADVYKFIKYVEFLEMIGRVADTKF